MEMTEHLSETVVRNCCRICESVSSKKTGKYRYSSELDFPKKPDIDLEADALEKSGFNRVFVPKSAWSREAALNVVCNSEGDSFCVFSTAKNMITELMVKFEHLPAIVFYHMYNAGDFSGDTYGYITNGSQRYIPDYGGFKTALEEEMPNRMCLKQ